LHDRVDVDGYRWAYHDDLLRQRLEMPERSFDAVLPAAEIDRARKCGRWRMVGSFPVQLSVVAEPVLGPDDEVVSVLQSVEMVPQPEAVRVGRTVVDQNGIHCHHTPAARHD